MDTVIFGLKDSFAIELKDYNQTKRSGKIRLWLNGKQFGDLKRKDELYDAVASFKILIREKEALYEKQFEAMSNEQIFSYCLMLDRNIDLPTEAEYEFVNKMRQTFSLWFGEQLDNVSHVIFHKDGFYHFLWSYNAYSSKQIEFLKNLTFTKISSMAVESALASFLLEVG